MQQSFGVLKTQKGVALMSDIIVDMIEKYREENEKYNFFDLNCWWDCSMRKVFHQPKSFNQLKSELKSHGIKKAVITNAECIKYEHLSGNENTAMMIKDDEDFYGCMVMVPEMQFKGKYLKGYIDKKIEQKFVAARMFPKILHHSMKKWMIGDILEYLEYKRLPLIVWHNEVSRDYIEGLCQEYKNLPVIIEGNDVKLLYHSRNYITLMNRFDNLYIETHRLIIHGEIDYILDTISDEKLIFGTYFPYDTPNAYMMPITEAFAEESSKYKVAGQNLQRLIDDIR